MDNSETKQTYAGITKQIEGIKDAVRALANEAFTCYFLVLNPTISNKVQTYKKIRKSLNDDVETFMSQFNDVLDHLVSNPAVIDISIQLKSNNNRELKGDYHISTQLEEVKGSMYYPAIDLPTVENTTAQQSTQKPITMNEAVKHVLGMMGFDTNSLNGFGDNEFGGFGAVMQVREKQLENRFLQAEKDRKYDELVAEKTKLECKIEELQKELDKANKYTDELEEKIEGLEDDVDELEHLKPEYSIGGMSLVGILEKTATNLAIKHADVLGGLAGVSKDDMVSMLKNPTQTTTQAPLQSTENVEVETVGKHSAQIDEIAKFLNLLSDEDFNDIWTMMMAFSNDTKLIAKAKNSLTNE